MHFMKFGFAAVAFAALIGFGENAANASPLSPARGLSAQSNIAQVQYRDHRRRYGPPRRVCRWETVERRIRGRIARERIERCRMVRR